MQPFLLGVTVLLAAGLPAAAQKPAIHTFTKQDAGKPPKGWTAAKTGQGDGSVWQVVPDATAPSKTGHVLAQTAEGPSRLFNLCVMDQGRHRDLEATVAFKSVKGKIDQGGGIAWRYQNADNYYICRYNPLEENIRVYKVVNGRRSQLATQEGLMFPANVWHRLSIKHVGDMIECSLEDKLLLKAKDNSLGEAGKVALWTKADAQTYFDSLAVTAK